MKALLIFTMTWLIISCNGQTKDDAKDIKDCFAGYKSSILENKGDEAIKWVDKNTLNYYGKMLQLAISADSKTVSNLGILDKMTVLTVRHRIPKEEVLKMKGNSFFTYAINSGMVGKNSVMTLEIGDIEISGNLAKGQLVVNGQKAPLYFQFNKENDKWKIDITSIFPASIIGLKQVIKNNGLTENEFILNALRGLTGKEADVSIWKPLT